MQALSRFEPRLGRLAFAALIGLLAAVSLAFAARATAAPAPPPTRAPAPKSCPGFRVLHADRIGAAVFPAGSYTVNLEGTGLTCKSSAELFARFLEDYDGVLPRPWKATGEGSGKASFARGAQGGFSVELTRKAQEGGTNPNLGTLCPGTFSVRSTTVVGALRFTKGAFLIYLPRGSALTCANASALFTSFLAATPTLPSPWKLINQTATFYQPAAPARTAFRIEPLSGAGPR